LCPSDHPPETIGDATYGTQGKSNYMYCAGDWFGDAGYDPADKVPRGMFGFRTRTAMRDLTDGSSNTIAMSERAFSQNSLDVVGNIAINLGTAADLRNNPSLCRNVSVSGAHYGSGVTTTRRSGANWANGNPFFSGFNTILPPNSPSCAATNWGGEWGIFPPTSRHVGGAMVLMADGAVRFISQNINAGNPTLPVTTAGVSPFGVWGSLGSKAGSEVLGEF
jgi:prepilin-type processing-associated H-X9-DG protein